MNQSKHPFKIGFLLSGSGTTLENLLSHISLGFVRAEVSVVISSKDNAYGIKRAESWNIPSYTVAYKDYKNDHELYTDKIFGILDNYDVNLVVLGGFMSRISIPKAYRNKVINIHPALIPAFSGQGYYGDHVYQKVLEYGVKYTGCTVHFVDDEYDHGSIIAQKIVAIDPRETLESLQEKVQLVERELYPKVIQAIVEKRLKINGRLVTIALDY